MNSGAWPLRGSARRRAVLKVGLGFSLDHLRRAQRAVARSAGYPTPVWLAVGETTAGLRYQVQDFILGRPADPLTLQTARLLVDLIEHQAGLDPLPERDWSAYVLAELDVRKEQLRQWAPVLSDVVDHYEQLLAQLGPVELPGGDPVHGDFNRCNVLVHRWQVSGAIDIAALGSGTRTIDYAWLLREVYAAGTGDPKIIRLIRRAGEAVQGRRRWRLVRPSRRWNGCCGW